MPLHRRDLDLAVKDGILSRRQAERLWARASEGDGPSPDREVAGPVAARRHAAAAGAAAAASVAAGWLLLVAWEELGAAGGFAAAAALGLAFGLAARALERRSLRIAAGLLASVAVALAPLAVHALNRWLGWSVAGPPGSLVALVRGSYFPATIAAVLAGAVALRVFVSPVVAAMLCGAIWFAVMLVAPLVFGPSPTWTQRAFLSALAGIVMIGVGVTLDGRTRRDVSFWLYLAGLVAFWGGLTSIPPETGPSQLFAAAAHVVLVLASIALRRRVFALFGAVGLAGVVGHAAEAVLERAALVLAIAAIAATVAAAAIVYRRRVPGWEDALAERLPEPVRRLLPPRRPGA